MQVQSALQAFAMIFNKLILICTALGALIEYLTACCDR